MCEYDNWKSYAYIRSVHHVHVTRSWSEGKNSGRHFDIASLSHDLKKKHGKRRCRFCGACHAVSLDRVMYDKSANNIEIPLTIFPLLHDLFVTRTWRALRMYVCVWLFRLCHTHTCILIVAPPMDTFLPVRVRKHAHVHGKNIFNLLYSIGRCRVIHEAAPAGRRAMTEWYAPAVPGSQVLVAWSVLVPGSLQSIDIWAAFWICAWDGAQLKEERDALPSHCVERDAPPSLRADKY